MGLARVFVALRITRFAVQGRLTGSGGGISPLAIPKCWKDSTLSSCLAYKNCISGRERPDILAALDLLEPKDNGRRDFETFHEIVGPTQSDNDTPASILDGVTEGQDHHDSTPDQSKSPLLPCEDTKSSSPGNFIREPDSMVSSRPPSSSDRSVEPSPGHSNQTTVQTLTSHMSCSRILADCNSSQARLSATLSAEPLNRSFHNTSNVPVRYGTTITTPSLTLDPCVIRQDYTSYQPMAASSDQLPFCHGWARSGITFDDSNFSTDFRWLSQLDAGKADVGRTSFFPSIM